MELRRSFDRVPEIYDRARPSYPEPLFDELFAYIAVTGPAIVEIGPATGQATKSLLDRRAHVTAVEIGPGMASFLRQKFADNGRLDVVNSSFEAAALPLAGFDAVVSATAFHWIDPAVRLQKSQEISKGCAAQPSSHGTGFSTVGPGQSQAEA
jgi:16S rRNA A1518/A1519 N6-dimethyltransferase RsmA/KsgA/DIM1 with predicted DNA glycosylase/AP lyase activity